MKKILVMSLMVLISYMASATEVIYHDLGRVQQLDTNFKTNSYVIPYKSCDSVSIVCEVTDTLTIESVVVDILSIGGIKVKSDTLLSSTTINGGVRAIPFRALPYDKLYINYRVHIKFKGRTYKKASANFYLVYIKEN